MVETIIHTYQHELTNLVRLAEYFGKHEDFYIKIGSNTVFLYNKKHNNLNYIVSDGSDQDELLNYIKEAKKECASFFFVYLSQKKGELLKKITIDNNIKIFKGETLFIKPKHTEEIHKYGYEIKEKIIDSQLEYVEYMKDDLVMGSMKLFYDGQDMGIYELVIEKEYRMKGFGRDMISFAKAIAFKRKAELLIAQVEQNISLFYINLGFKRLGKLLVIKIESIA